MISAATAAWFRCRSATEGGKLMFFYRIRMFFSRLFLRLRFRGETHYIGTAETLPPPLSPEEEEEILGLLDENRENRRKLVERNLRLVVYIAKKFENTGIGLEDLISIGTIGLIKDRKSVV